MTKTYTRARAAKAALVKLLEGHEATDYRIETFPVGDDRFSAEVHFTGRPDVLLTEDLDATGFNYEWDEPEDTGTTEDDLELEVAEPEQLFNLFSAGHLTAGQYSMATTLWATAAVEKGDISVTEKMAYLDLVEGQILEAAHAATAPAKSPSGYIREKSTATNAVATVWAIADSMPGAARKDVIEACRQRGVAYGTARTQYQAWKKAKG